MFVVIVQRVEERARVAFFVNGDITSHGAQHALLPQPVMLHS